MAQADSPASVLATLAFGLAGALAFVAAGLPAPWLSGAMFGVVVMLLLDRRPRLPEALRDLGTLLAGVVMGSAITPEMVGAMARYPLSLALLALTTLLITLAGRATLVRMFGWRRRDAVFASLPGALSAVVAFAGAAGADLSRVSAVQAFRMFVLVAMLPSILTMAHGADRSGIAASLLAPEGFAIVMLASLALALLLERGGMIAPFLLGGMLVAGLTHATGLVPGASPAPVANLSMLLIGVFAGSRVRHVTRRDLGALILPALMLFCVTSAVAALGALATTWLVGIPLVECFVAFAPGGLEAMIALGIAMGLDPLFVSSHHIARFVMISAALPIAMRWLVGRED